MAIEDGAEQTDRPTFSTQGRVFTATAGIQYRAAGPFLQTTQSTFFWALFLCRIYMHVQKALDYIFSRLKVCGTIFTHTRHYAENLFHKIFKFDAQETLPVNLQIIFTA